MNNNNKKKKALISIIGIAVCVLVSCSAVGLNYNWRHFFTTTYKQDTNSPAGQLCSVWNGRIYYVNNEKGNSGIYSMNMEGEDNRFELETSRIVKLQSTEDYIYYVGLCAIGRNKEKLYGLFEYNKINKETNLIAGTGAKDSVFNVFVTEDNEVFYRTIESLKSSFGDYSANCKVDMQNEESILNSGYISISEKQEYWIGVYKDYIMLVEEGPDYWKLGDNYIGGPSDSMYSFDTQENLMWDSWFRRNCDLKVIYVDINNIYLGYMNNVLIIDRKTLETKETISINELTEEDRIDYAIENDGKLILISSQDEEIVKLVLFYKENNAFNSLMEFDRETVLVNIQNGCILYANEKTLVCQRIGEYSLGDVEYEIELNKNIVNNTIFEVVSNWLFIYDKGKERDNEAIKLRYVVNLVNKEIIKK